MPRLYLGQSVKGFGLLLVFGIDYCLLLILVLFLIALHEGVD